MNIDHQSYYTGISLIDNQHEHYLCLVDDMFALCEEPKVEQAAVEDGLTRVLAYAIEHFDAEEALMLSTQYPGYETHRMKHNEFRDEADRLHDICKKDIDPEDLVIRLTKWLVEWIYEQVLTHDKALAAFLKKQRQESPNH